MLEILGFIVLLGFGLYAFFGGVVCLFAATAFGSVHRIDFVISAALVVVGGLMLWGAIHLCPFTISFERAAQAAKQGAAG